MKRKLFSVFVISSFFVFVAGEISAFAGQGQPIKTNKDKLLTLAVQGEIAPAEPSRSYAVTWDGKPKMAIGQSFWLG